MLSVPFISKFVRPLNSSYLLTGSTNKERCDTHSTRRPPFGGQSDSTLFRYHTIINDQTTLLHLFDNHSEQRKPHAVCQHNSCHSHVPSALAGPQRAAILKPREPVSCQDMNAVVARSWQTNPCAPVDMEQHNELTFLLFACACKEMVSQIWELFLMLCLWSMWFISLYT